MLRSHTEHRATSTVLVVGGVCPSLSSLNKNCSRLLWRLLGQSSVDLIPIDFVCNAVRIVAMGEWWRQWEVRCQSIRIMYEDMLTNDGRGCTRTISITAISNNSKRNSHKIFRHPSCISGRKLLSAFHFAPRGDLLIRRNDRTYSAQLYTLKRQGRNRMGNSTAKKKKTSIHQVPVLGLPLMYELERSGDAN